MAYVMDMKEIVYLNGELIPGSEARISPLGYGFLLGYGAFETMRAYGGIIFRLDRHMARLRHAAELLGIAGKLGAFDLEQACRDVLKANSLADARVRLTVAGGEGDIVPNPDTLKGINVFIVARKLLPRPAQSYEQGYKAAISSYRTNSHSPLSGLKSTSYLANVLARQEARAAGMDEVILLNEQGFVAEGAATNIFLFNGDVLITPPVESGILPGITREVVLELAESLGIRKIVRQVRPDELLSATEAFVTSSTIEIMPLTRLDNKSIGPGKPGSITQRLMLSYRELVDKETKGGNY